MKTHMSKVDQNWLRRQNSKQFLVSIAGNTEDFFGSRASQAQMNRRTDRKNHFLDRFTDNPTSGTPRHTREGRYLPIDYVVWNKIIIIISVKS